MRWRRRREPPARLAVSAEPVLRAGAPTRVVVDTDGSGDLRVSLRLLGWDMRAPQKWLLDERPAASGELTVTLPDDLPPGCARMTEYAIFAELVGQRVAAAAPVRLISDTVFALDGPQSEGAIALDADAVALGGTVAGRIDGAAGETVEIGAELHTLVGTAAARFQPAVTATVDPDGTFTATLPRDVPPTLSDGEELAIVWVARAGAAWRRFAVADPDGHAGERRPALLTFLAQLSRDPFALR